MSRPDQSTAFSIARTTGLCVALYASLMALAPLPASGQAPAPNLLDDLLRHTAEQPSVLPLDFAQPLAPRLSVVWHQNPEAPLAYAVPWAAVSSQEPEAPATRDDTPRLGTLFLHVSYLGADNHMRPFCDLPVDAAEQLLHALLDVYLTSLWPPTQAAPTNDIGRRLQQRAEVLLPDLPAWARREAYLTALGDFGAHILSVANEVERLFTRRGSRLCAAVDLRQTLFGLWNRCFRDGRYAGRYYQPAPAAAAAPAEGERELELGRQEGQLTGRWVETTPLNVEDKRLLVEVVLGAEWRGDARADLAARHCSP